MSLLETVIGGTVAAMGAIVLGTTAAWSVRGQRRSRRAVLSRSNGVDTGAPSLAEDDK